MRLKAIPRQRRINTHQIPMSNPTQEMSKEFVDIEEYARIVESQKKPETRTSSKVFENTNQDKTERPVTGKYVEAIQSILDTDTPKYGNSGAMNLSLKDGLRASVADQNSNSMDGIDCTSSDEKFAGSLLYQIMTDPEFVENIRHNKEMKKLTCKFCKKKFDNDKNLQDHLESRMNELNQITCCACGKIFGQKRYLRYHQRYHVEKNKFTCGFCTKKYSRMDNLARHRNYHTNPDKYTCETCKKSFSRRDFMTKHMKSHQSKEINCDLSSKVFISRAEIKTHRLQTHKQNYK